MSLKPILFDLIPLARAEGIGPRRLSRLTGLSTRYLASITASLRLLPMSRMPGRIKPSGTVEQKVVAVRAQVRSNPRKPAHQRAKASGVGETKRGRE